MRCSKARDLLGHYLSGVISMHDHQALKKHLEACSDCAQIRSQLQGPAPELQPLSRIALQQVAQQMQPALDAALDRVAARAPVREPSLGRRLAGSTAAVWLTGMALGAGAMWMVQPVQQELPSTFAQHTVSAPAQLLATNTVWLNDSDPELQPVDLEWVNWVADTEDSSSPLPDVWNSFATIIQ